MQFRRSSSLYFLIIPCIAALANLGCGKDDPQGPDPIVTGPDTIPPAAITDLTARYPTVSTIALVWFAPGDDGTAGTAASYDLRYSPEPINDQNWHTAAAIPGLAPPKPAGQLETVVITGLPSNSRAYFALKTSDEVPNESALSNNAMETTLQEQTPPATIGDLMAVAISGTEFLLTWTAPGDDWMEGNAFAYDIRYDRFPITELNWPTRTRAEGEPMPAPAGSPDSFVVTGLQANTNYYFAMMAEDDVGNRSAMSNVSPALALSNYLLVSPLRPDIGQDTQIIFRTSPDVPTKVEILRNYYVYYQGFTWMIFRHLVDGQYQGQSEMVIWDTANDDGETDPDPWSMQYRIRLYWGDAPIDSLDFQILQ